VELGPVEYMVVSFEGNNFSGEIVPELMRLVDNETIRVLDLVFIAKDGAGDILEFEFDQLDELAPFGELDAEIGGIVSPEDVAYVASMLEPNSSCGILVWEDLWAKPFVEAVGRANGKMLQGARIPRELIASAFDALASSN
jgi:Family of unknown function (DUF6325)